MYELFASSTVSSHHLLKFKKNKHRLLPDRIQEVTTLPYETAPTSIEIKKEEKVSIHKEDLCLNQNGGACSQSIRFRNRVNIMMMCYHHHHLSR